MEDHLAAITKQLKEASLSAQRLDTVMQYLSIVDSDDSRMRELEANCKAPKVVSTWAVHYLGLYSRLGMADKFLQTLPNVYELKGEKRTLLIEGQVLRQLVVALLNSLRLKPMFSIDKVAREVVKVAPEFDVYYDCIMRLLYAGGVNTAKDLAEEMAQAFPSHSDLVSKVRRVLFISIKSNELLQEHRVKLCLVAVAIKAQSVAVFESRGLELLLQRIMILKGSQLFFGSPAEEFLKQYCLRFPQAAVAVVSLIEEMRTEAEETPFK